MKAIVEISGRQFCVQEGDIINLFKIDHPKGHQFAIENILAVEKDGVMIIDREALKNFSVLAEIVEEKKGKKIHSFKKKKKTGYHRKIGYRDSISVVKIVGIQKIDATS
jgi:large subunit ribosomal protein L21